MAKTTHKKISLDGGLVMLLAVCLLSTLFTFRKFRQYQSLVDDTMSRNLETMRNEHKRSLDELKELVNSGLLKVSSASVSVPSSNSVSRASISSVRSVYRQLPNGLKIVQCGDWYLTDGVWKYGRGDVSPIGVITNISRGVVWSDIDTFSCVNIPVVVSDFSKKSSKGGKP